MSEFKTIIAKYPAKCIVCGEEVGEGEECYWKQGQGVKHIYCSCEKE